MTVRTFQKKAYGNGDSLEDGVKRAKGIVNALGLVLAGSVLLLQLFQTKELSSGRNLLMTINALSESGLQSRGRFVPGN